MSCLTGIAARWRLPPADVKDGDWVLYPPYDAPDDWEPREPGVKLLPSPSGDPTRRRAQRPRRHCPPRPPGPAPALRCGQCDSGHTGDDRLEGGSGSDSCDGGADREEGHEGAGEASQLHRRRERCLHAYDYTPRGYLCQLASQLTVPQLASGWSWIPRPG